MTVNSTKAEPSKWAVVTDFDGTVTLKDVSDDLLLHFKITDKETIEKAYAPSVNVEKWMEAYYRLVKISRRRIEDRVRAASRLRAGFGELRDFCENRRIPLEIVSGGLDLYIECLLKHWRLKVNYYCARTRFTPAGILVNYPFLKRTTLELFKARRVEYYHSRGCKVLFCGDGTSDLKAARLADAVFATKKLRDFCLGQGVRHRRLKNFFTVRDFIEKNITARDGK